MFVPVAKIYSVSSGVLTLHIVSSVPPCILSNGVISRMVLTGSRPEPLARLKKMLTKVGPAFTARKSWFNVIISVMLVIISSPWRQLTTFSRVAFVPTATFTTTFVPYLAYTCACASATSLSNPLGRHLDRDRPLRLGLVHLGRPPLGVHVPNVGLGRHVEYYLAPGDYLLRRLRVPQVQLHEPEPLVVLQVSEVIHMPLAEVVDRCNLVSFRKKPINDVAPYESGTSRHERLQFRWASRWLLILAFARISSRIHS